MKYTLKAIAEYLALIFIIPAFVAYRFNRMLLGPQKAFAGFSQLLSLFPGLAGVYLRCAFYRLVFPQCGQGSWIGFGTIFSHPTAEIGPNVYIGSYCCLGDVTLEADVLLGSNVSIMNGSNQHGIERLDIPIREQPGVWPRITIGCDTWIGDRAIVMADVGKHCVIGAGSVVTKPIPDYAIAVGSPARIVRFRNESACAGDSETGSKIQPNDMSKQRGESVRYFLLDPLRGLAALWVFGFHFHFSEAFQDVFPVLHSVLRVGDLGVPMFFVISGYCLMASSRSVIRKTQSSTGFLWRRFLRIYPPFWCSIVVVIALPFLIEWLSSLKTGTFVQPTAENRNYGFLEFGISDWLRYTTLTQVFYPDPEAANLQAKFTMLNAVYWTLAIEFQFYLAVTIALVFRKWFFAILAVLTVVSLPCAFRPEMSVTGIFLPFWPMFALGIGLFYSLEKGFTPTAVFGSLAPWLSGAVIVTGISSFVTFAGLGFHIAAMTFAIFFAIVLWFGSVFDESLARQANKPMIAAIRFPLAALLALGAMSYSLYLLHGRLHFLVAQLTRQLLPVNSIGFDAAVISITCIVCYAFYRYCELPFYATNRGKANTVVADKVLQPEPKAIEVAAV